MENFLKIIKRVYPSFFDKVSDVSRLFWGCHFCLIDSILTCILETKTNQFKYGHYESDLMKSKLRETLGRRPWFSMHFQTKAGENIMVISQLET